MTEIDPACCEHISVVWRVCWRQVWVSLASRRISLASGLFSFQKPNCVNTSRINVSMCNFNAVVCFQNLKVQANYFIQNLNGTRTASTVELSCYLPALFHQRICQIGHFCPDSRCVNKDNSGFIVGITPITIISRDETFYHPTKKARSKREYSTGSQS